MKDKIAIYECCNCGYRYQGNLGPQPDCPRCGDVYFKWLNYKKLKKKKIV